jgi:hypothetical protein
MVLVELSDRRIDQQQGVPMAESRESVRGRHRDLLLYTVAFVGLVVLGQIWKGSLSMILSPFWMLLVIWILPSGIARIVGYRR